MAKKTAIQNFKLKPETKKEYNDLLEEKGSSASNDLRQFVHRRIEELKAEKL
jgi:hypothetical protein